MSQYYMVSQYEQIVHEKGKSLYSKLVSQFIKEEKYILPRVRFTNYSNVKFLIGYSLIPHKADL